jgi:geranylgeranyl diphosphate synthase type II
MRYSIFAGGKRIRPIITLAAAELCGAGDAEALPVACALEMIHTYSLIHDDLPAMDNDDMRRGRLTNHKVYGEGLAILAGDTLMTFAYHLIAREYALSGLPPERVVRLIAEIGEATGISGMAGGQVLDLESEGKAISLETLKKIHELKTGALIRAAIRCGAIIAGAQDDILDRLTGYAQHLGIVFQIVDDILDVTSTTETLGKPVGSDEKNNKVTYVSLCGLEKAKEIAQEEAEAALKTIGPLEGKDKFFAELINYFLCRES